MRPLRIVLLSFDGGVVERTLAAAPDLLLLKASSFAGAASALTEATVSAVVIALQEPSAGDANEVKQLLRGLRVPCLVVSASADNERIVALIKAGAGGYLLDHDRDFVVTALRELVRGGAPMSEPISRLVMQRARRSSATMAAVVPSQESAAKLLTPRQQEILKLLQLGHSYDDIGVALSLSINTVRSHVRVIYDRLGAASKVEAVMIALELGILERPRDTSRPPA